MRRRHHRWIAPALALGVALGLTLAACGDDDGGTAASTTEPVDQSGIPGVIAEPGQDNGHVEDPTYDAAPPSGGDHIAAWLNCGVYDTPVPDGNAVHSLEHGAVWIAYDPGLDENSIAALAPLASQVNGKLIIAPYPGLDSDIVVVAWGHRFIPESATDRDLVNFVLSFVDAPTAPEPGAPCDGGVGPA